MAGPRVAILYEDKTAGGLHRLVSAMVQHQRRRSGREPFAYFKDLPMKGNSKLVAECSSFQRMRFFAPHRADHVFAVIDGYEVENAIDSAPRPRQPAASGENAAFDAYCKELDTAVCRRLRELAMAPFTPQQTRLDEEQRFHPFVLFWERESIFLAGRETLHRARGIHFPEHYATPEAVHRTRHPTKMIENAWKECKSGKYSKAIDGPNLFGALAADHAGWPQLLAAVPCLKHLVDTLANL